ncbi:MAG: mechanosensitive ion channel [Bacteroidetes bacterium]|nr:mechanosensitive ion channel [Bacteroidota bacterium]
MNRLPNLKDILINTFTKLIDQFSTFFSNLVSAIVILIIGWVIAKTASILIKNVLSRVGIDKVGDKIKEIDAIKKFNLDFKLSQILSTIVYIFIMLFLSVSAADTLGVPAISNMFLMLVNFIPKLIVASIMLLIGLFVSDLAKNFVNSLTKSFNIASGKLIGLGVFFFVLFISVILALGQAGINTSLLESSFNILIAGIVLAFSIGYGFASKDILLNIVSSFYSKNKYTEGQIVEISGVKGTILKMDNTSIVLDTEEGETVFPLKVLQNEKVVIFNK